MEILETEIPEFISPLSWPPNSPDFNPVDYSAWSKLQEKAHNTRITDLRTAWAGVDHIIIAAVVCQYQLVSVQAVLQ